MINDHDKTKIYFPCLSTFKRYLNSPLLSARLSFLAPFERVQFVLTYTMAENESMSPVIGPLTTSDGFKVNSVILAEHLIPSSFEDSKLVARPAMELLKRYTDSSAKDMVPALGSTENIYFF